MTGYVPSEGFGTYPHRLNPQPLTQQTLATFPPTHAEQPGQTLVRIFALIAGLAAYEFSNLGFVFNYVAYSVRFFCLSNLGSGIGGRTSTPM